MVQRKTKNTTKAPPLKNQKSLQRFEEAIAKTEFKLSHFIDRSLDIRFYVGTNNLNFVSPALVLLFNTHY